MRKRGGLRDVLAARDPARTRLIVAIAVSSGVLGSAALAEFLIHRHGADAALVVVAIFLSLQAGNMVKDRTPARRLVTTVLLIPTIVTAILLAVLLSEQRVLVAGVFVVISGAAIWVRRFGVRAGAIGAVGFMGYFFALFMKPSVAELGAFCLIAAGAVTSQAIVRGALLLRRPRREITVLVNELRAASLATLDAASHRVRPGVLRARMARIDAVGTAIDFWQRRFATERYIMADEQTLDERVLDARVDTEEIGYALARSPVHARDLQDDVQEGLVHLRSVLAPAATAVNITAATAWAESRLARSKALESGILSAEGPSPLEGLIARGVHAHVRLHQIDLARALEDGTLPPRAGQTTVSASDPPSSAPGIRQAASPEHHQHTFWRPWKNWAPTTRMAVQAMIAAALASGIGEAISASRWYWAVMTAFVIFIGTSTRSGILTRAYRRITGTAIGITVGMVIVALTGGNADALIAICVLGVFGMLYFGPLNYLYSALFLTVMLVSMYRLLGVLNGNILELRLAETVAGAIIGVTCAYLILSASSKPQLVAKVNSYFDALDELLLAASSDPNATATDRTLRVALRSLEDSQSDLDQAVSAMATAFLVTEPRQRTMDVHLMFVCTRAAARVVQSGSGQTSGEVREAIAVVRANSTVARRTLADPRARTDEATPLAPAVPTIVASVQQTSSTALVALARMEWALQRIIYRSATVSVGRELPGGRRRTQSKSAVVPPL